MRWRDCEPGELSLLLCVPMKAMIYQREPLNFAEVDYEDQTPKPYFEFELRDTTQLCEASLLKLRRPSHFEVFQTNHPKCWEAWEGTGSTVLPWFDLVSALPSPFSDDAAAGDALAQLIGTMQRDEPLTCQAQAVVLSLMRTHPTCSQFEVPISLLNLLGDSSADSEPTDSRSFKVDRVSSHFLSNPKPMLATMEASGDSDLGSLQYFGAQASVSAFKNTSDAEATPACPATVEPSSSSTGAPVGSLTASSLQAATATSMPASGDSPVDTVKAGAAADTVNVVSPHPSSGSCVVPDADLEREQSLNDDDNVSVASGQTVQSSCSATSRAVSESEREVMTQAAAFLTSAQAVRALTGEAADRDFSMDQAQKLIGHFVLMQEAREAREQRKRARSATASQGKKSHRRRATRSTSPSTTLPPKPQDEPAEQIVQASSSSADIPPSDAQVDYEQLKFRFDQHEETAHLFEQQCDNQIAVMQERLSDLQTLLAADHATMQGTAKDLEHYIADQDQAMVLHTTLNWQVREELKQAHQKSFDRLASQLTGLKGLADEVAKERELVQHLFLQLETLRSRSPPSLVSQFLQVSRSIHSRLAQLSGYVKSTAESLRFPQWNQI